MGTTAATGACDEISGSPQPDATMNNPAMPTLDEPELLSEKAARAWENSTDNTVAREAGQAWSNTRGKAAEVIQSGGRYVREHPGTSVLGVFGAGMLVGVLVAWTSAREQRNNTADSIHHFLTRLGRKLNLD